MPHWGRLWFALAWPCALCIFLLSCGVPAQQDNTTTNPVIIVPGDGKPHRVPIVSDKPIIAQIVPAYPVFTLLPPGNDVLQANMDLQAALDALPTGNHGGWGDGGVVTVPAGMNRVPKPLRVRKPHTTLRGIRKTTSAIGAEGFVGPVLIVAPDYPGMPTGPALVTGSQGSVRLEGSFFPYLNLRDGDQCNLHGLTALTLECWWKPTALTNGSILSCQGEIALGRNTGQPLQLYVTNDGRVLGRLKTTSGQHYLQSAPNLLAVGQSVHLALSYDGFKVRLFVNGVRRAEAVATGTVVQLAHQDVLLGPVPYHYPEIGFMDFSAQGDVDGLTIWKTCRYPATFTPPTTLPTKHTDMILQLGHGTWDLCSVGWIPNAPAYFPTRRSPNFLGDVTIEDLEIEGEMQCHHTTSCRFERLQASRLFVRAESFLNVFRELNLLGSRRGVFVVNYGGPNRYERITATGGAYPVVVAAGAGTFSEVWVAPNYETVIGLVLRGFTGGNSVYTLITTGVDDEPYIPPGMIRPIESAVLLDDCQCVFQGCNLEIAMPPLPGPRPVIQMNKCQGVTFTGSILRNASSGPALWWSEPPTQKVNVLGSRFDGQGGWTTKAQAGYVSVANSMTEVLRP